MSAPSCRNCPEHLKGCTMVECARCGKVLCQKKEAINRVNTGNAYCDECWFDICESGELEEE